LGKEGSRVALRAPYTTLNPEFDAFLFAPIGEEGNGMSLSVMSALTRLNIDPWREAAQLSKLSKERAVEALSPIIARVPVGRWTAVDIPAIALRLVDFLPRHDVVIQSVATLRVSRKVQSRAIYVIAMILLAILYFGFIAHNKAPAASDSASSTMSDAPH
jgi:hypothetical protein